MYNRNWNVIIFGLESDIMHGVIVKDNSSGGDL